VVFLKEYLVILKIKLLSNWVQIKKIIINNIFLFVVNLVILVITIKNSYLIILLIIYNIFILKKDKKIFYINIFISLVFFLLYVINCVIVKDYQLSSFEGIITDIDYYDDYNKIIIKNKFKKVLVYHYYEGSYNYKIGDVIDVKGINVIMEEARVPMGYNNKENLLSKRIISVISVTNIDNISKNFNIYYLKRILVDYFNNNYSNTSKQFLFALVLGDTSYLDDNINNNIKINGIAHLFAISGLHINLLIIWLDKCIEKIDKRNYKVVRNIFLGLYLLITNFSNSVTRAVLTSYFTQINKKYNLRYSSLDICSSVFILMLFINPFISINIGFQLSFLVTFVIILFSKTLNNYSNIFQNLFLSLLSFLFSLPIVINVNNYINILSPFTSIIFVYIITFLILPLSFVVTLFPFLDKIYLFMINIFIAINDFVSTKLSILIDLPNFHILESVIYYILVICLFVLYNTKNFKKVLFVFSMFLLMYYNKSSLSPFDEIIFLDLRDGEAILINSRFNDYTVLIDTGDGTNKEVSRFLKKKGIRKLDFLILTHNHQDHNGEADIILNEIKVDKIVTSEYDISKYCYKENSVRVKKGDSIKKGKLTLEFISPSSDNLDENDNSLIIFTKLGNYKYIFLGDASTKVLDKLDVDVDIVKGGHHGSKTSSSYKFYNKASPEYVILQTGRTKKYNFPNKETIDLLDYMKIKVLRTDKNASICIYYNKFFSVIKKMYE